MGLYIKMLPNNNLEMKMGMSSTIVNIYELQKALSNLKVDDSYNFESLVQQSKIISYATSKDILNNPKKYIGASVINYDCEVPEAVDKWKIFYADETNIFLIADDYIHGIFWPYGKRGSQIPVLGYSCELNCIISDYNNLGKIDERLYKHFEFLKYYDSKMCWQSLSKLAYMIDTNAWSIYKGENAEYAIAGPTIDLFVKSYNLVYPENKIEYKVSEMGYELKYKNGYFSSSGVAGLKPYHFLYYKIDEQKAQGMYVLGNFTTYGDLMVSDCLGNLEMYSSSNLKSKFSFRPVVCLKENTKLEEISEGVYKIASSSY